MMTQPDTIALIDTLTDLTHERCQDMMLGNATTLRMMAYTDRTDGTQGWLSEYFCGYDGLAAAYVFAMAPGPRSVHNFNAPGMTLAHLDPFQPGMSITVRSGICDGACGRPASLYATSVKLRTVSRHWGL